MVGDSDNFFVWSLRLLNILWSVRFMYFLADTKTVVCRNETNSSIAEVTV